MNMIKTKRYIVTFTNGIAKKDTEEKLQFSYDEESGIKVNANGVEFLSEPVNNTFASHYICELDTKTNEITWSPAEMVLMNIKPKTRKDIETDSKDTYLEKTLRLAEEFGNNKMKKEARSRKKRIESSAAAASAIEKNFNSLSINTTQAPPEEEVEDNLYNIIPTKNPSPKSANDIYNIHDIIPENLFSRLSKYSNEFSLYCQNCIEKNDAKLPKFISEVYFKFKLDQNEPGSEEKIQLMLFWYYLYTFAYAFEHHKLWKDVRQYEAMQNIPRSIRKHLKSQFVISKSLPPTMKTKAICHLLILALKVSDYNLDCLPLIKDLHIKLSKMKVFLKAIGCSVSQNSEKHSRKRKANAEPFITNEEASFSAQLILKV